MRTAYGGGESMTRGGVRPCSACSVSACSPLFDVRGGGLALFVYTGVPQTTHAPSQRDRSGACTIKDPQTHLENGTQLAERGEQHVNGEVLLAPYELLVAWVVVQNVQLVLHEAVQSLAPLVGVLL